MIITGPQLSENIVWCKHKLNFIGTNFTIIPLLSLSSSSFHLCLSFKKITYLLLTHIFTRTLTHTHAHSAMAQGTQCTVTHIARKRRYDITLSPVGCGPMGRPEGEETQKRGDAEQNKVKWRQSKSDKRREERDIG